ncbi:hypothetical protein F0562_009590 [Nyssa sinensis]|uniref:Uncharacterized protein n=1 Tax=Nyssa sinensis TaxID=561372 RepID=A0A5J5A1H4_9ASTE|nr:hypothetical protein F0562_009590 [Nyssa sinensis]
MASSISLRLPITDVNPHVMPLLFLPTHFCLAVTVTAKSPDDPGRNNLGTIASATTAAGISPELLLVAETSPELVVLGKSSVLPNTDMVELVDAKSRYNMT